MTKVYYNGACPVCAAGITRQRRKLEGSSAEIEWIDVNEDNDAVCKIGADLEFVRERLHVVDDSGALQVGDRAFSALWHLTPGEKWRAWVSDLPIVRSVLGWVYNAFAARLYRWNRRKGHW